MALPCDAPPSASLSPKASAPDPSVWERSGDVERTKAGTDKIMSAGEAAAEDSVGSGAWEGVGAAMWGGASSQGASLCCPESGTLSAGGCADSHTQTHAISNYSCTRQAIHENKKKYSTQSWLNT